MKVFHRLEDIEPELEASVVAIGNFDGCHLGHGALIGPMVQDARSKQLPSVVLTFYPPPVEVLSPGAHLERLTTTEEKLGLLEGLGVDLVLVEPFTPQLAELSPDLFFQRYLARGLGAKSIHVGFNFFFGKDRAGDIKKLSALCQEQDTKLNVLQPFDVGGVRVSSSLIRKYLIEGRVTKVRELLGRPFAITGKVVKGDQRGKTLGFATANLLCPERKAIPADGVYATRALWQRQSFCSVTNIGFRPTFESESTVGGGRAIIETHLLDFETNLYDESIELQFLERIRDEKRFDSVDDLKVQIRQDIKRALACEKGDLL